jgi:hypothetical protein
MAAECMADVCGVVSSSSASSLSSSAASSSALLFLLTGRLVSSPSSCCDHDDGFLLANAREICSLEKSPAAPVICRLGPVFDRWRACAWFSVATIESGRLRGALSVVCAGRRCHDIARGGAARLKRFSSGSYEEASRSFVGEAERLREWWLAILGTGMGAVAVLAVVVSAASESTSKSRSGIAIDVFASDSEKVGPSSGGIKGTDGDSRWRGGGGVEAGLDF